jgi:hypothetical protein
MGHLNRAFCINQQNLRWFLIVTVEQRFLIVLNSGGCECISLTPFCLWLDPKYCKSSYKSLEQAGTANITNVQSGSE